MQRLQGWVKYAAEALPVGKQQQAGGAKQEDEDDDAFIYGRVAVHSDDEEGRCSWWLVVAAELRDAACSNSRAVAPSVCFLHHAHACVMCCDDLPQTVTTITSSTLAAVQPYRRQAAPHQT